jgi:hypothetical protein
MVYLNVEALHTMHADLARFYDAVAPGTRDAVAPSARRDRPRRGS